jgi:hypothetical protein
MGRRCEGECCGARVVTVTRAESARRQMFADYSSKAGTASRRSTSAHRLTDADRRRAARRRRLNALLRKDVA